MNVRQFDDEKFVCKLLFLSKSIVFFNEKYYFKNLQDHTGLGTQQTSIRLNPVL